LENVREESVKWVSGGRLGKNTEGKEGKERIKGGTETFDGAKHRKHR